MLPLSAIAETEVSAVDEAAVVVAATAAAAARVVEELAAAADEIEDVWLCDCG
jgi:hypothetical protein